MKRKLMVHCRFDHPLASGLYRAPCLTTTSPSDVSRRNEGPGLVAFVNTPAEPMPAVPPPQQPRRATRSSSRCSGAPTLGARASTTRTRSSSPISRPTTRRCSPKCAARSRAERLVVHGRRRHGRRRGRRDRERDGSRDRARRAAREVDRGETANETRSVRARDQAGDEGGERADPHLRAAHPEYRGMGTTATVAGLLGDTLYLAQVGDSRAYLVRNGVARQITKDQSLMQKLIEAGELTEEEAAQSERRNIILQALGPEPYDQGRSHAPDRAPRRHAGALQRRAVGPGDEGRDRGDRNRGARPRDGVQTADRSREREWRPGQHHGDRRALRWERARGPERDDEIGHHEFPLPSDGTPTDAVTVEVMPPSVMVRPGARPIHLGESTVPMPPAPAAATPPRSQTPPQTPTCRPSARAPEGFFSYRCSRCWW